MDLSGLADKLRLEIRILQAAQQVGALGAFVRDQQHCQGSPPFPWESAKPGKYGAGTASFPTVGPPGARAHSCLGHRRRPSHRTLLTTLYALLNAYPTVD